MGGCHEQTMKEILERFMNSLLIALGRAGAWGGDVDEVEEVSG